MTAVSSCSHLTITLVILSVSWEEKPCQWKETDGKILWLLFICRATKIKLLKVTPFLFLAFFLKLPMPILPKVGRFDITLILLFCGYVLFSQLINLSIVDVDAPGFPVPMALLLERHLLFMASVYAIFMNYFLILSRWKWSLFFLNSGNMCLSVPPTSLMLFLLAFYFLFLCISSKIVQGRWLWEVSWGSADSL